MLRKRGNMAKITRVDRAGTFYTTFIFDGDAYGGGSVESNEITVLASEADAIQTKIENATWAQILAIYNRDNTSIIKVS